MRQGEIKKLARRFRESGNPDGLTKTHRCLAGLLHFVRNDGTGIVARPQAVAIQNSKRLDCFTAFAMTSFRIPVIATRHQLRAQRGRSEADVAI